MPASNKPMKCSMEKAGRWCLEKRDLRMPSEMLSVLCHEGMALAFGGLHNPRLTALKFGKLQASSDVMHRQGPLFTSQMQEIKMK
jgi:hypothetical protein